MTLLVPQEFFVGTMENTAGKDELAISLKVNTMLFSSNIW